MTAFVRLPNVSMVFLLAVLFAAARFGLWPALLASGLSFLAYNFFFIEPLHTFSVAEPHELLALFVLLAVAVLTSAIAGRARDQARTALERARLAEEVNAVRTAAEAERVRNILLASISHDFRTPLASILGAATSLIDYGARLPEPARRDLLAQIKDEAEHLDGMVRNLLAMTRVEAGGLEINRDWVDIRELFDRAVAMAKRRGATQRFEVALEPGLPFAPADPILLDQVLANLIGNAARYAGPAAQIVLAAREESGAIVLTVVDDGPGIPSAVLPHVFEKFVRAPRSGGDAGEGSGLGLAIAKGIVDAHRGSIAVTSPVANGRGTKFEIRLPLEERPR
jgi:two-component system, OmpR family, sensor histidine kinase KdpD